MQRHTKGRMKKNMALQRNVQVMSNGETRHMCGIFCEEEFMKEANTEKDSKERNDEREKKSDRGKKEKYRREQENV